MIDLPEIFRNDTQGNTTNLIPLIVINNRLYLSTQKTKLNDNVYLPFLKKMGNISEGVDINDRKYKVSNSNLTFYNYTYNNAKLIDVIMQEETFNTSLDIYYKSQNAKSLDDCLKVYSGYIKNIEENKDDINISCEDKTEQVLGKDVPQRFTEAIEQLDEKHNNVPIPIVYGEVDRSPLIYRLLDEVNNDYKLIADDFQLNNIDKFLIFTNDNYFEVVEDPDLFTSQSQDTLFDNANSFQWELSENNEILIDKTLNLKDDVVSESSASYLGECSPIRYGFVQVLYKTKLVFINGYNRVTRAINSDTEDNIYSVANINLYKGVNNNEEINNLYEGVLDVRDFSDIPDVVADGNHWIFGSDFDFFESSESVQYFGKNWINFKADPLPSDSKIVTELRVSMLDSTDDDFVEPKEINPCEFRTKYNIDFGVHKDYWDNLPTESGQGESYDQLYLHCILGDNHYANSGGFSPEDLIDAADGDYIANSADESSWRKQKTAVTNTEIVISNYFPHREDLVILPQAGSLKWLKINEFEIEKKILLKDFDKYDLYSYVLGRVDNEDLRYTTSLTTLTEEARAVRPSRDVSVKPTRITRPRKPVAKIQKPVKRQPKKTSKGGY